MLGERAMREGAEVATRRAAVIRSALAALLALAPVGAHADEWSGLVKAYAAYANAGCAEAEAALVYEAIVRDFPNSEFAEHAMLRVVTLARGPEPERAAPAEGEQPVRGDLAVIHPGASYPELLHYAGIEGWALLGFDILPDGRVADVHVIRSDPPFLFDLSAALSLSRWYYKPVARKGEHVKLIFNVEH